MNPWDILGIRPGATPDEIKAAWKRKAFAFHPDRGGDPEDFKRALWAYETLRDQASTQMGAGEQSVAPNQMDSDFREYAQAYYDAWFAVPSDIRFWFNTFETIHTASMFVAHPFFFGGLLMLLGGLLNNREQQTVVGFLLATVCGIILALAYGKFWENLRFDLRDRYARKAAKSTALAVQEDVKPETQSRAAGPQTADEKGQAFGCLVVCAALILFAFLIPAKDADDVGGRNVFVFLVGIPLAFALYTLFTNSNQSQ